MLNILLPHREYSGANPVFEIGLTHLHWPRTNSDLKKYGAAVLAGTLCLTIGWWIIERVHINFSYIPPSWENNLPIGVFLLSLIVTLLSSFFTITLTIGAVQHGLNSGWWDIIRITPPGSDALVEAYDTIAQIRSWRLTIAEVALRLATVVLLELNWLYSYWFVDSQQDSHSFWARTIGSPFFWLLMAAELIFFAVFILEPLYRMRAIVALGIAIAVRFGTFPYNLLAGFLAISLIHLLQAGAALSMYLAVISLINLEAFVCVIPIGYLTTIGVFFFLYSTLRDRALLSAIN